MAAQAKINPNIASGICKLTSCRPLSVQRWLADTTSAYPACGPAHACARWRVRVGCKFATQDHHLRGAPQKQVAGMYLWTVIVDVSTTAMAGQGKETVKQSRKQVEVDVKVQGKIIPKKVQFVISSGESVGVSRTRSAWDRSAEACKPSHDECSNACAGANARTLRRGVHAGIEAQECTSTSISGAYFF